MLWHILRVIFILLEVIILFNLLIVVHELGHFLAARWRGLYIEGFGVWFGKPIWKKTINGVQYSLGSLPFGGFVKLPQLAPMDVIEGKADVVYGSRFLKPTSRVPFKSRAAYRWACEVSVYLDPGRRRGGAGRAVVRGGRRRPGSSRLPSPAGSAPPRRTATPRARRTPPPATAGTR
jgi:membrane-associated protease RseP (regulator of RpoE activity)